MTTWDPALYLRYADERLRPALDLLDRVPLDKPARIIDLGCGTGSATAELHALFPGAEVIGVDSSAAMLAQAGQTAPGCRFVTKDITSWKPEAPPDLIFSNAALHWAERHEALLPRLLGMLAPGGVLAAQMPAMHEEPLRELQYEVAANGPWAEKLINVHTAPPVLSASAYWDMLSPRAARVDIWQTTYLHVLSGEDAAAQWAAGSSLRPFLDALNKSEKTAFLNAYKAALKPYYPKQSGGTTLLPFQRLFIVAQVAAR